MPALGCDRQSIGSEYGLSSLDVDSIFSDSSMPGTPPARCDSLDTARSAGIAGLSEAFAPEGEFFDTRRFLLGTDPSSVGDISSLLLLSLDLSVGLLGVRVPLPPTAEATEMPRGAMAAHRRDAQVWGTRSM